MRERLNDNGVNMEVDSPNKAAATMRRGVRLHTTKERHMTDTTRPRNLRANVIPTDGFALSVDKKLKTMYQTAEEAMAAGSKLKQKFPVTQVAVYDAAGEVYTPVELQEEK